MLISQKPNGPTSCLLFPPFLIGERRELCALCTLESAHSQDYQHKCKVLWTKEGHEPKGGVGNGCIARKRRTHIQPHAQARRRRRRWDGERGRGMEREDRHTITSIHIIDDIILRVENDREGSGGNNGPLLLPTSFPSPIHHSRFLLRERKPQIAPAYNQGLLSH